MHPYFFNTAAEPLFGIYAPPRTQSPRDEAVLLCPPVGHEYIRAHWALRQLADHLTQAGLHVFRFDYSGMGDSWGSFAEGSIARWVDDVRTALEELADNAGTRRVSLLGLRLGAALAFAAAGDTAVDRLILWDPVVQGQTYLDELRALERERRHGEHIPSSAELVGYRYDAALMGEIAALDLIAAPLPKAKRIRLLASADRPEYRALYARLSALRPDTDQQVCPDAGDWDAAPLYAESVLLGPLQRLLVDSLGEGS